MKLQGALMKEKDLTFAIVKMKPNVLYSADPEVLRGRIRPYFPLGIPIILMAQDGQERPTYHGKSDIVNLLANIDFSQVPWKEYTV